jgi:pimeloyl-ACP methyl ester carboxylesterase
MRLLAFLPIVAGLTAPLLAQVPPTQKQIPPPGIVLPESDAAELKAGIDALGKEIESLRTAVKTRPALAALLPDVEILHKAVRYAVTYGEFFDPKQIAIAKAQLGLGSQRARELREGKPTWTSATGAVVRGYTSRLDGSPQPYGLVVPREWKAGDKTPRPLWLWFHGRDEKLTELAFIEQRLGGKGEFKPEGAFVLHLYGRFCNASKFAGEVDAFEAMADVKRQYAIDPNRIVVAGFSMGGATIWHLASHHAGLWAAASPGAGFAETATYAKVFDAKKEAPPWWEQSLYNWYDATTYAANLANCPLVAYSGEIDPQKQSADVMEEAMEKEGLKLERLIGPKTAHKYEPETKKELQRRLEAYAQKGRESFPRNVHFTTYTLAHWKMEWLQLWGMEKEWERADIDASVSDAGEMVVKTGNVSEFWIVIPDGATPPIRRVIVDGQKVAESDSCTFLALLKNDGKWARLSDLPKPLDLRVLRKRPTLCGPIDAAFMDSFIFVRPTGKPLNDKVGAWAKSELDRAIFEWRRVFRGDARVKDDTAVTPDDIKNSSLVLWGDPGSNALLARMLQKLPVRWTREKLVMGKLSLDAADHAPILIFPNPLNPQRYVVLNSGFTFREGSTTSNSLQTPKLPDWAAIDLRTPPGLKWPGLVVDAGFFDEQWQWPK